MPSIGQSKDFPEPVEVHKQFHTYFALIACDQPLEVFVFVMPILSLYSSGMYYMLGQAGTASALGFCCIFVKHCTTLCQGEAMYTAQADKGGHIQL